MTPVESGDRLGVEVVNETSVPIDEEAAARVVFHVLELESVPEGDVVVAFVEEDAIAGLNDRYRGIEGPTDVLSFPGGADDDPDWPEPEELPVPFLGDVIIAPVVAAQNAAADDLSTDQELTHLIVHGVLHLLGYDHEIDTGEQRAREAEILEDPRLGSPRLLLPS